MRLTLATAWLLLTLVVLILAIEYFDVRCVIVEDHYVCIANR